MGRLFSGKKKSNVRRETGPLKLVVSFMENWGRDCTEEYQKGYPSVNFFTDEDSAAGSDGAGCGQRITMSTAGKGTLPEVSRCLHLSWGMHSVISPSPSPHAHCLTLPDLRMCLSIPSLNLSKRRPRTWAE